MRLVQASSVSFQESTVDALGASIIGIVSGIIVVVVVEFLDMKLHIDDPVGAVAVHLANGIWGTLSDGLFNVENGVFYGGGFKHFGVQCLGEFTIVAWTTVCMIITFTLIKKLHGLRASREEEIVGLDKLEHGIDSSYAGFIMAPQVLGGDAPAASESSVPVEKAVPVAKATARPDAKFHMVTIITRQSKFDKVPYGYNHYTPEQVRRAQGCNERHQRNRYDSYKCTWLRTAARKRSEVSWC